jgi:DNA-directed RNA polymerase specialized sigma24 family protein
MLPTATGSFQGPVVSAPAESATVEFLRVGDSGYDDGPTAPPVSPEEPPRLQVPDGGPAPSLALEMHSPLAQAVHRDDLSGYEAALGRLGPVDREAVIARIERQSSYEEIARALGQPTADAARALVVSALFRLCEEMGHDA